MREGGEFMRARYIEKVRDKNNKIIGYTLLDQSGNKLSIKSDDLKNAIRNNEIEVLNLTLTSNNRLIASKEKSDPDKIRAILNRAISLGMNIKQFKTGCGHDCYILSKDDKHMLIIPDDVTKFYEDDINKHMRNLTGSLRVIGGKNLIDASYMFTDCKAQFINLSSFDTSKVANMNSMFFNCEAQSINLSSFDTSNVTDMSWLFANCNAQSINLSSFDTRNVTNMNSMFANCKVHSINLSSFDTSKVTGMSAMFANCKVQSINLSSFDTRNVTDMKWMFSDCKILNSIDLSLFDIGKLEDTIGMFSDAEGSFVISGKVYHRLKNEIVAGNISITIKDV